MSVIKIPYFQTTRYRVEAMVELAEAQPGEKVADLGSGDGRIVIAFAKHGIEMHGYEIDEELRKQSEEDIKKLHLENAFIHNKDFWEEDLSLYDIICCYPMPTIMGRLERKLQEELKHGSRVLLNYFPFKHWKEKKVKDNIFLYIKH
ncbi:MAG TPA: methyltransferase domain-containing protein [Candidatus Saccharimonadales bacterium]|nr:methyltransferase domain-containing protein [Candidatus Saccharimonadales bacterium]